MLDELGDLDLQTNDCCLDELVAQALQRCACLGIVAKHVAQ